MKNKTPKEALANAWAQLQIAGKALSQAAVDTEDFELGCDISMAVRATIKASRRAAHLLAEAANEAHK